MGYVVRIAARYRRRSAADGEFAVLAHPITPVSIVVVRGATRTLVRGEGGQSLLVVALSVVLLLGALALAVDWGYGLTQRRVLQGASDAAALGAGRYLATSVIEVNGGLAFSVHGEEVWCEARRFLDVNDSFRPGEAAVGFTLQFGSGSEPIVWTDAAPPASGACPAVGDAQVVPADTIYVRVTDELTYRPLIANVLGQSSIRAASSARAKLSGTPSSLAGPVWPMVRHYDPADFDTPCADESCDPTVVDPITFWSSNEPNVVYGSFKGLIDPSRYSDRHDPGVGQLVDDWDRTGSVHAGTVPKEDFSGGPGGNGNCPGGRWDTAGNEDPQQYDKQCSIPNWFYYSFQGELSLERDWVADATGAQERPSVLTGRAICDAPARPDPKVSPSCDHPTQGDWVETALSSGDLGNNVSANMRALIADQGRPGPFSEMIVRSGPNRGEPYGKSLVVVVYLWDCAEAYTKGAPAGERWDLVMAPGGADCAMVPHGGSAKSPDRVHLFTVAPFTFYEGLVTRQEIRGYWGGQFGEPRVCRDCGLSTFSNTVFLVADD